MTARHLSRILAGGFGLALLLTLFIDVAILVVPLYDMQLYDRVLMSRNMDTVMVLSLACVIGLLFYGCFDFLRSAAFLAIADGLARRLNGPVLEEGIRRAAAGDRSAGPQLARDVQHVQSFLASGAVATPLDALCAPMFVVVLFILHPAFGWLAVAGIAGIILAGLISEAMLDPVLKRAQERRRAADHALSRSLAETELTDGVGMLPAIALRWCGRYADAVRTLSRVTTLSEVVAGASRFLRFCLQAGVMALGAILIIRGQTTPGSLMGANLLMSKTFGPFDHLVGSCRTWLIARDSWRRLRTFLPDSSDPIVPIETASEPGLVVRTVSLKTPDGIGLLRDLDFHLAPGTFAVVSGRNGSGKTTLLRLLAGVVHPSRGVVLLDGAPVQGGPEIGYLPQAVCLLDGTVAANVGRLQDDLPGVIEAARKSHVHDRIGRMANGYGTLLSGNGASLSGGMKQRIGLARALFGAPRLLLLDEPDASLDVEGSDALLHAIRDCSARGTITVAISHRPALLEAADLIIEMEPGQISALRARAPAPTRHVETA